MAQEPIWNRIVAALAAALAGIRTASSTAYWHTVKAVYTEAPEEWDRSRLPAISVEVVPEQEPRVYAGGSRQVNARMNFLLTVALDEDAGDVDDPYKAMQRMVADIHRALYVTPDLGLSQVRRATFPIGPVLEDGFSAGDNQVVGFRYQVVVEYSFMDDAP